MLSAKMGAILSKGTWVNASCTDKKLQLHVNSKHVIY